MFGFGKERMGEHIIYVYINYDYLCKIFKEILNETIMKKKKNRRIHNNNNNKKEDHANIHTT